MGALDQNNRLKALLKIESQHAATKNSDSAKKNKTEFSTGKEALKNTGAQLYHPPNPKVLSQFQSLYQDKRTELQVGKKARIATKNKPADSKPVVVVNL